MASSEEGGREIVLSRRGQHCVAEPDDLGYYSLKLVFNPYHPQDNPHGIVNMGVAVNRLMEEELECRLQGPEGMRYDRSFQHYFENYGLQQCRLAAADFLQRHLCPGKVIDSDKVVVLNGVAACLDGLGHALCDPGDVLITPTPVYYRIFSDFRERACVDVRPVNLSPEMDSDGKSFSFQPEHLEVRIKELSNEGKTVKGLILVHPQNPLGDFYSKDKLLKILQICAKYKLHVVVDEIYALSVFRDEKKFVSSLAIHPVPDPDRLHFVWGISKDFGLAGFRVGVFYSANQDIVNCMKKFGQYNSTPSIIQDACAAFLNDKAWSDNFLCENLKKLRESYDYASQSLKEMGFRVREANSGLFVWADGRNFLPEATKEAEIDLFKEFFDNGVYVVPGSELYCITPGWFRFLFSIEQHDLKCGLERVKEVVDKRRKSLSKL